MNRLSEASYSHLLYQKHIGNTSWLSGKLIDDYAVRLFCNEDPETPIATILELVLKPLALYGGIDVFIFTQIYPYNDTEIPPSRRWNGDIATYEELYADYSTCQLYRSHALFHPSTGNKVFCKCEYEKPLSNAFIERFSFWESYYYGSIRESKEMLLQQLYGIYRANLACKQYAIANNVKYVYKMRLRPDLAAAAEFPKMNTINFGPSASNCKSTIYYPSLVFFRTGGAEDSFNIGLAEVSLVTLWSYVSC